MPRGGRGNKASWKARQLARQPEAYAHTGEKGLALRAAKSFIGKRFANCHEQVKAADIVKFVRANRKKGLDPYDAIYAFNFFGVFTNYTSEAAMRLGLDMDRVGGIYAEVESVKRARGKETNKNSARVIAYMLTSKARAIPKGKTLVVSYGLGGPPVERLYPKGKVPRMKPVAPHRPVQGRSARARIIRFFHSNLAGDIAIQPRRIGEFIGTHKGGREKAIAELSAFMGASGVAIAPVALKMGMSSKQVWDAIDKGRARKKK
ncbi:MAG: hypothetical protein NT067_01775 [Candidatus Diapherotrites archaeon]|nr:hypothetical protein [Candidatus Diapherotrites archaeon]